MNAYIEAQLFRNSAETKRYHTKRMLREQTVGAHTFNMLLLVRQLAPASRPEVLWACVHHDLPEHFTGDIPAPVKRASTELKVIIDGLESDLAPLYYEPELSVEEWALVKWVDLMELVLFCIEEIRLGNRMPDTLDMVLTGLTWLRDMKAPNDTAFALWNQVRLDAYQLGITKCLSLHM